VRGRQVSPAGEILATHRKAGKKKNYSRTTEVFYGQKGVGGGGKKTSDYDWGGRKRLRSENRGDKRGLCLTGSSATGKGWQTRGKKSRQTGKHAGRERQKKSARGDGVQRRRHRKNFSRTKFEKEKGGVFRDSGQLRRNRKKGMFTCLSGRAARRTQETRRKEG